MQIGLKYNQGTNALFFMSSSGSASASLENLQTCQTKALFSTVLARVLNNDFISTPLVFGTHVHTAQFARAYYLLDRIPELFERLAIRPFHFDSLFDLQTKVLLPILEKEPLPAYGKRTAQTLFKIIEAYNKEFEEDPLEFVLYKDSQGTLRPLLETPFALPLVHNDTDTVSITFDKPLELAFIENDRVVKRMIETMTIIYQGVFDAIRSFCGSIYIHDYKTTAVDPKEDQKFFDYKGFSNQFMGYYWAASQQCQELYTPAGEHLEPVIKGITCDRMAIQSMTQSDELTKLKARKKSLEGIQAKMKAGTAKPADLKKLATLNTDIAKFGQIVNSGNGNNIKFAFERKPLEDDYTPTKIAFWKASIIATVENFMENHARGVYPQNRSACSTQYGMCPYFDVCKEEPTEQLKKVMGFGYKTRVFEERK